MIKPLTVDNPSIKNLRVYGKKPYSVVVVHGGPGAAGEMAAVAVEMSSELGILEPFQSALSIDGQIEELRGLLDNAASLPCILVGFSWGAWLSLMCAAHFPELVRKLILIGSGPFRENYADDTNETRLNRFSQQEKIEFEFLIEKLKKSGDRSKNTDFARLGTLLSKADAFEPIAQEASDLEYRFDIFSKVWQEAAELRRNGELLQLARKIRCPVVAIHGDFDPHPAEGVLKPLSDILQEFSFFLLKNCGHKPWIERQARDEFFSLLRQELNV
jgi:pimeloyl-ACP methyl ester carboxylesterase